MRGCLRFAAVRVQRQRSRRQCPMRECPRRAAMGAVLLNVVVSVVCGLGRRQWPPSPEAGDQGERARPHWYVRVRPWGRHRQYLAAWVGPGAWHRQFGRGLVGAVWLPSV